MKKPTKARLLKNYQEHAGPSLKTLREHIQIVSTLDPSTSAEERKSAESLLCLYTGSAYLDFFSWINIKGTVIESAEKELGDLLCSSITLISDPDLKDCVQIRYEDMQEECGRVRDREKYNASQRRTHFNKCTITKPKRRSTEREASLSDSSFIDFSL